MTLQIEISPEREQQLRNEADQRGIPVEELARELIEQSGLPLKPRVIDPETHRRILDELAAIGAHLEPNPEETYSRETIYADHD